MISADTSTLQQTEVFKANSIRQLERIKDDFKSAYDPSTLTTKDTRYGPDKKLLMSNLITTIIDAVQQNELEVVDSRLMGIIEDLAEKYKAFITSKLDNIKDLDELSLQFSSLLSYIEENMPTLLNSKSKLTNFFNFEHIEDLSIQNCIDHIKQEIGRVKKRYMLTIEIEAEKEKEIIEAEARAAIEEQRQQEENKAKDIALINKYKVDPEFSEFLKSRLDKLGISDSKLTTIKFKKLILDFLGQKYQYRRNTPSDVYEDAEYIRKSDQKIANYQAGDEIELSRDDLVEEKEKHFEIPELT